MAKLPIRPVIVVDANPKIIDKNEMINISARFFDKKTLRLKEVSRIYMTITSLKDGHIVWPLEVIRKDTSGFDIGIGTVEMNEGEEYLVRISNNWNLSPNASTTFSLKKSTFPIAPILIPLFFSPLFIRKYQDKGITDVASLTQYLKSQGFSDEKIKDELKRILEEVEIGNDVKIPIDNTRQIASKKWIIPVMDERVCKFCKENTENHSTGLEDGRYFADDSNAPTVPEHPHCRCTFELDYVNDRTPEFRAAAMIAHLPDIEAMETLSILSIISSHAK